MFRNITIIPVIIDKSCIFGNIYYYVYVINVTVSCRRLRLFCGYWGNAMFLRMYVCMYALFIQQNDRVQLCMGLHYLYNITTTTAVV